MEGHPVWFEIHVTDVERAEAFYTAVAGWRFETLAGMPADSYRMIANTPEGFLGGAIVTGFPDRTGSGTVLYLAVEDLQQAITAAVAHGGALVNAEQTINAADGSFAQISDPDGNLLGLWTR